MSSFRFFPSNRSYSLWHWFIYFLAFNFVLFSVAIVFSQRDEFLYVAIVIDIVVLFFLFFLQGHFSKKKMLFSSLLMLFLFFSLLNVNTGFGKFFPLFFGLLIMACFFGIYYSRIDEQDFVRFTNVFFYLYLLLSFADFFLNYSDGIYKSFEFGINGSALRGLEGSPANIDIFAVFFTLVNLFYSNKRRKYFNILVGLATVFLAGTLTPIFVIIVVLMARIAMFLGFANRLIYSMYVVLASMIIFYSSTEFADSEYVLLITNGRSIIWEQQFIAYFSNLTFLSGILGNTEAMIVDIPWRENVTNNPHNSYIFILLRFGMMFLLFSIIFFYLKVGNMKKVDFLLLIALISAGFSGITPVYITNPYYFLLGAFLILKKKTIILDYGKV